MYTLLLGFLLFVSFNQSYASDSTKIVYRFEIKTEIAPPAWRLTQEAFYEADTNDADILFLELDTYGGRVDMADSIRTIILRSKIPVYVLVKNNAASAGALISIACDSIYMQPGSSIGAATVIDQNGQPSIPKIQSYFSSKMRATAERRDRNPDIAEAMVDPDKYIPGIIDSGKVLTFTTSQAIAHNYCQAEVVTMKEALEHAGITDYEVISYKASTIDNIINWLINPAISGVLILIIMGGIYFELQSPGIGFPILASAIAATLFFAPYYLEGLAENWEILLFLAGLALLAAEVFVIPGFGIAGISGITLIVTALILSMVGNIGFDFEPVDGTEFFTAASTVIMSITLSVFGAILLAAKLFKDGPLSRLVLKSEQNPEEGYTVNPDAKHELVGQKAIAATDLRPAGKVEINGELWDAYSEEGYISTGSQVVITGVSNTQLKVLSDTALV